MDKCKCRNYFNEWAVSLSTLKDKNIKQPIAYVGSHVQALPVDTLSSERSIDILTNEEYMLCTIF